MSRECPKCKAAIPETAPNPPFFPFCSERCRLLDLGAWLDGEYRIAGPSVEDERSSEPSDDEN